MSVHTTIRNKGLYFITFTCYNWMDLIANVNGYDLVYQWFDLLTKQGHSVTGYVIMPNHIHLQLYFSGIKILNSIIGNSKRFLAYEIIDRLRREKKFSVLQYLHDAVSDKDRLKGKLHEVWKNGFDVKSCRTEKFILQKLNYMHNNPCSGKWKLSEKPTSYEHSSSSFYDLGIKKYKHLKDYRDFLWTQEE
jgi:REP element-mobilizing transposase RayT